MNDISVSNSELMNELAILSYQAKHMFVNNSPKARFSSYIKRAVNGVDKQITDSEQLKNRYTMEDPNVSLSEVFLKMQKAEIALASLVSVRNKFINAYKTINNMSL